MTSTFKHLRAIILLPGVVTIVFRGIVISFRLDQFILFISLFVDKWAKIEQTRKLA